MKNLYTVDQVSKLLNIHPKTIQRYIREGKLHATKIGKGWRITGHALSLFTESNAPLTLAKEKSPKPHIIASSVIDIIVVEKEEAIGIINTLTASMNAKPFEYGTASLHSQYIEQENKVRFTLWGDIRFMAIMLDIIMTLTD